MADRKISDLTALTTPATGDLIPIVDISEAAAADKNKSITVGELLRGAPDGTAAAPGIAFESDGGNGMFLGGTDILAFSTGGTQAVTIDASQRLGIGTSSPSQVLDVQANDARFNLTSTGSGQTVGISIKGGGGGGDTYNYIESLDSAGTQKWYIGSNGTANTLAFKTNGNNERMRIDSSGNVGIGTTSPSNTLDIVKTGSDDVTTARIASTATSGANNATLILNNGGTGNATLRFDYESSTNRASIFVPSSAQELAFSTNGSNERMRIDSSGRLLVGTSSWSTDHGVVVAKSGSNSGGSLFVGKYDNVMTSGDFAGQVAFGSSYDGNIGALIKSEADAAWTHGSSHPGRLVFSTTADGASSPTERMRISSQGAVMGTLRGGDFLGLISATNFHSFDQDEDQWTLGVRNTNATQPYGIYIKYNNASPNGTGFPFLYCEDGGGTLRMAVRSNGGIANYSANNANLCDEREKKNIESLDSTWGCLKNWELKKFHYNEDADTDDKRYGVIAQQVAQHCPEVITEWVKQKAEDAVLDEDGNVVTPAVEEVTRMGVKEQQMMWMAIKALQEAQTRIETLEAEVAALKAQ